VAAADLLFDRIETDIQVAAVDINSRIETEFASLKKRIEELDEMHVTGIRSYALLQRYRGGDTGALDSLRSNDPGVMEFVGTGRPPTSKKIELAERYIIERSTTIRTLREQLEPEFLVYRENQAEIDALRTQADERARLGRITLILWGRSHRNLAAGIPVRPMIDVMGIMKTTVDTGVKGVLP
jgi:hypothetical protein